MLAKLSFSEQTETENIDHISIIKSGMSVLVCNIVKKKKKSWENMNFVP